MRTHLAERDCRGLGTYPEGIGPALHVAIPDAVPGDAGRSSDPTVRGPRPVRPVGPRHRTETPSGDHLRLTVELANGVRATAPVVDLRRLAGVDSGQLQQGQAANRLLRELDALPEHVRSRPRRAVLNDERRPMRLRVRRPLPRQRGGKGQRQSDERANYDRRARRRDLHIRHTPTARSARPPSSGGPSAGRPVCARMGAVVGVGCGVAVAVVAAGQASKGTAASETPLAVRGRRRNAAGASVLANSLLYGLEMAPASAPLATCCPARYDSAWSSRVCHAASDCSCAARMAWMASSSEFGSGPAAGELPKPPVSKTLCR